LVEPNTGGDPMTADKFVRTSLRSLSDDLHRLGHPASPPTVAHLLRDQKYNLHVNVKRLTGPPHPDRDQQFRHIQERIAEFRTAGWPILSVDSKKKELIGNFGNVGATWCQSGTEVNAHDFPSDAQCKAVPYGLYDVLANRGHVVVGTSADTSEFATDAIAAWWGRIGSTRYPRAGALLVLADAGGSNGCRPRLWKYRLQGLADRYGLVVNVCHYPTGASKWNPVEHRLFGPISVNWAGTPLRSPEVMLSCLRGTTTQGGLRVSAQWQTRVYPKGVKVTHAEMDRVHILKGDLCPRWNYSIVPGDLWE
jgi:hypothetical protein